MYNVYVYSLISEWILLQKPVVVSVSELDYFNSTNMAKNRIEEKRGIGMLC